MRQRFLAQVETLFDGLEQLWESASTQRRLATGLTIFFLLALGVIELRRRGWLPVAFAEKISSSHFEALHISFTLLLIIEVVSLVFGLAQSVANAAGKQFEIMSLILIRQSFKELSYLGEPIAWEQARDVVLRITSDALGALLIFASVGLFYRIQRHQPITRDTEEQHSFVATKKGIALVLLVGLGFMGVQLGWLALKHEPLFSFFEAFYTLLIFADVLIVLISMRYSTAYYVVFRYFGFAIATVFLRLALTAPYGINAAMGLGATLFAVALTWTYNRAVPAFRDEDV